MAGLVRIQHNVIASIVDMVHQLESDAGTAVSTEPPYGKSREVRRYLLRPWCCLAARDRLSLSQRRIARRGCTLAEL